MRKNTLLVLLALPVCFAANAQSFTVGNRDQNIVYVGLPNPIQVTVENTDDKNVSLSSPDAKIEKNENGYYDVTTDKIGKIGITVWKKNKNGKRDSIGIAEFRSKEIPNPTAFLDGKSSGTIKRQVLMVSPGLIVRLLDVGICAMYKVTSFTCIIIHKNGEVKHFTTNSALFTDNMKMEFAFLAKNETLLFCNIHCIAPDGKDRLLAPIEFTITE